MAAGWNDASYIKKTTERQIPECVEECCKQKINGEQLYLMEQTIKCLYSQIYMFEPEDRVCKLYREYCNASAKAGYGDLQKTKPHLVIAHITKVQKRQQLYKVIVDIIKWRESKNVYKENTHRFMQKVATQDEKLQVEHRMIYAHINNIERRHTYVSH